MSLSIKDVRIVDISGKVPGEKHASSYLFQVVRDVLISNKCKI